MIRDTACVTREILGQPAFELLRGDELSLGEDI